jgi:hypothetical protein
MERKTFMIEPLHNAVDDDWALMVGRFMLNMGAVELATRLLVVQITGSDRDPVSASDLSLRLGFIRKRFPREDRERHSWAMNVFAVAAKHVGFRNIVAHGGIVIVTDNSGALHVGGILHPTPKDPVNKAYLVSLEELKGRVNETAVVGREILTMQRDFGLKPAG